MNRIIFFVPCFASGGAEAFTVNVAEKLNKDIFEPVILSIDQHDTVYDERLEKAGIKRIVLIDEYIRNPIKRYFRGYKLFRKYLMNNSDSISAIHFNIAQGEELPFIWLSKKCGIKIRILHSHNSSVNSRYKYYGHILCKSLFNNSATNYFACSDIAAEWLLPKKILRSKNYSIIKNGIDIKKYQFDSKVRESKRKALNIGDKIVYLNIGRLDEQKNQKFLLEAYNKICEEQSNSVLMIVGEGNLRKELEVQTETLGLRDRVVFLGNRTDISELLCAADIFLLPSLYEGLPITLIEAQTSGLPCVVSDNISEQCVLTDLATRVPLDIEIYSNTVCNLCNISDTDRAGYHERIAECGFNIEDTVDILEKYYFGEM